MGPNSGTSLPQSSIGAQAERSVNWTQTQDLAQVQFLPEIGLLDCRGHDKTTRVPEKAVVVERATRPPGLRQTRQTLSLGVAAAALMGRRMQDKERRCNNSDGQVHSSSYAHANSIALARQLPQRYPGSFGVHLLAMSVCMTVDFDYYPFVQAGLKRNLVNGLILS